MLRTYTLRVRAVNIETLVLLENAVYAHSPY